MCDVCDEDKEKGSNNTTKTSDIERRQSLLSSKSPIPIDSDFIATEKKNDDLNESIQEMNDYKTLSHPSHTSHSQNLVKSSIESVFDCYYCNHFHTIAENEYLSHGADKAPWKAYVSF